MTRRLALVALAMVACADTSGLGSGSVRVHAFIDTELREYSAPPLSQRWFFPYVRGDTVVSNIVEDAAGGLIATQYLQSSCCGSSVPPTWRLVRYDDSRTEVASRTAAQLVGADSLGLASLHWTPDRQLLVGVLMSHVARPGSGDLLVINPVTLDVMRRIPSGGGRQLFYTRAPLGTTGTQVLMWRATSVIWVDASTGAVIDSVAAPAGQVLGARAPGQLYVRPPSATVTLQLYDGHTGQVLASITDTAQGSWYPIPDTRRGQLVALVAGGIELFDAATLVSRGKVMIGTAASPRNFNHGHVDAATGAFVGATYQPVIVPGGAPPNDGIAVVDLDSRAVVLREILGVPLVVVP